MPILISAGASAANACAASAKPAASTAPVISQHEILPIFFVLAGQSTASGHSDTSVPDPAIMRVPEYAACADLRWTVDAGPSNVASRPEPAGRSGPAFKGGMTEHGRASARETETDAGDPAFLGRHARPANCGCSAATPAPTSISRRGRSARAAARARSASFKASGKAKLYSYVINHRPARPASRRLTPSPWWSWTKVRA